MTQESETWRDAAAKYPKLYEHGVAPAWRALGRKYDPHEKPLHECEPFLGDNTEKQFLAARSWIRARSDPDNKGAQDTGSYSLKHHFESWRRRRNEHDYITNGLFILAALEEGHRRTSSWDSPDPNIRIRTYFTDRRGEPLDCFWEFVMSRRAGENPRGDYIRDTQDAVTSRMVDSWSDTYRRCDQEMEHANDEARAEYGGLLCEWQRFRHRSDSDVPLCASGRIVFTKSEQEEHDEEPRYDVLLDGDPIGSISKDDETPHWRAETSRKFHNAWNAGEGARWDMKVRLSCNGRSRHRAVDALLARIHQWKKEDTLRIA